MQTREAEHSGPVSPSGKLPLPLTKVKMEVKLELDDNDDSNLTSVRPIAFGRCGVLAEKTPTFVLFNEFT